jgi:uncharacterized protein YjbI with pentapeptide repeats
MSTYILALALVLAVAGASVFSLGIFSKASSDPANAYAGLPSARRALGSCSPAMVCSNPITTLFSLSGANLTGVDLSHQDLSFANLQNSTLIGANLYGANLKNANLLGANVTLAQLSNAFLCGTVLPSGYVDNADCSS